MASTPTSKSQVQAHQFVLRRMQSALVRKDAVMLHDPMRSHSRATLVGVVISVLGMLGFLVVGMLSPAPSAPTDGIVIGKESGTVYVKTANPAKLIPTFNLASARLILMAQQQKNSGQGGGGQVAGGQAGGDANSSGEAPEAQVVSDDQLKDIPRGRLTGIPGGPDLLPSGEQRTSPEWSVCDRLDVDPSLNDPTSTDKLETAVFGGVPSLDRELAENEALLAKADNGKTYLIYRLEQSPNQPNADTVRAAIDQTTPAVESALQLAHAKPRHMSMALLNAIPEVNPLSPPDIANMNGKPGFDMPGGYSVGTVFRTETGEGPRYWVVLQKGVQQISMATADIIRSAASTTGEIPVTSPDQVANVPQVKPGDQGYLDVGDFPRIVPTVLDPAMNSQTSCLGWKTSGDGESRDGHTTVSVGAAFPGPKDQAVDVGEPGPDGLKVDKFYMPPGRAAVVRSATSKATFDKGPIQLISDRGVRYGVPDNPTAQGLGLAPQDPAPESIIRLLPTGASLNTTDAMRTFDSVPVDRNAGDYPPEQQGKPAGGN